ncbi:MAG: hypothetical protein JNL13_05205, partial [Chitinophagaceae bacterium]|nr:hypothetical protein [Chitinophagaceae bacterium]
MKKLLLYIGTLLLFSGTVQAQYMSGSVFLNGRYLETVVAPNGSMISSSPPPPGYHVGAGTAGRTYGLVADPDKDGWLIGFPPFTGDYTAFGYPIEDWILFADGNTARPDVGKWDTGITSGMKGVNTRYIATAKETGSEWQGKWNDLELRQLTTVSLDGLHIRVNIEFNNKGTTTIRDIYYARSCDPDIDGEFCKAVPPGSCLGLSTHNKIVNQSPDPKSRVWAYAQGDSLDYIMGITTNDCRAKAFFLEWNLRVTVRLDSLYNELVPYARYSVGYNFYTDAAMGLVFKLDSLKAGESTSISF